MIQRANADFWNDYRALPVDVRARADKQFALLKANPQHHAEIPCSCRQLTEEYLWFWIGEHNVYDALIS